MKIINESLYTIEISKNELAVIQKVFGKISKNSFMRDFNLNQEEVAEAEKIYIFINNLNLSIDL